MRLLSQLIIGVLGLGMICQGCGAHSKPTQVSAGSATATVLPKVVIQPFVFRGITESEGAGIAGKFCVEVSQCKRVDLLCSEELKQLAVYQQDQIAFGNCDSDECLAKLSQEVKAQFVLQGSLSKVGESYLIQINLFEAETGKVKNRFSKEVRSAKVEDVLDAVVELAKTITQHL